LEDVPSHETDDRFIGVEREGPGDEQADFYSRRQNENPEPRPPYCALM